MRVKLFPKVLETLVQPVVRRAAPDQALKQAARRMAPDVWKPSGSLLGNVEAESRIITPPAQSAPLTFSTITGAVKALLPDTAPKGGLPHQHFWFQEDAASGGKLMRVDNDLHFGTRVPNLAPDQPLTIRGVTYHDDPANGKPALDGIHWTHHRDLLNDAGFIKTAAGQVFQ